MQLKSRVRKLEQVKADEWDTPFDELSMISYEAAEVLGFPDDGSLIILTEYDEIDFLYPAPVQDEAIINGWLVIEKIGDELHLVESDKGRAHREQTS